MWDGYLDRISVVKYRIKLLDENTQTVQSAPYRARPKTREFEEAEVSKMLKDNKNAL